MIVIGQQSTIQVAFKTVSTCFAVCIAPADTGVPEPPLLFSSFLAIKVFYYPMILKMQRMGKVHLLIGITNIPTLF